MERELGPQQTPYLGPAAWDLKLIRIRIRIRVLLLIKVMPICDHWSTDPTRLHFDPRRLKCGRPRLHFEPLKLMGFDFYADPDPDPALHSNTDPAEASQNNADPDPQPYYAHC
jgi:hypothetical protein